MDFKHEHINNGYQNNDFVWESEWVKKYIFPDRVEEVVLSTKWQEP